MPLCNNPWPLADMTVREIQKKNISYMLLGVPFLCHPGQLPQILGWRVNLLFPHHIFLHSSILANWGTTEGNLIYNYDLLISLIYPRVNRRNNCFIEPLKISKTLMFKSTYLYKI